MSIFGKTASESRGLENALRLIAYAERQMEHHTQKSVGEAKVFLGEAKDILRSLKRNAVRGIHHNPPLTVFMNPPGRDSGERFHVRRHQYHGGVAPGLSLREVGQIAASVHLIRYTHVDDGKDYEHIFENEEVLAVACEDRSKARSVLLTGPLDIWDDY